MFSIIILLILAWSFYIGYSRGIVLQGYYAAATMVSMLVAGAFYKSLAKFISLWVPYASATQGSSTYFFPSSQLFQFFMLVWPISLFLRLSTSLGAFLGFLRI